VKEYVLDANAVIRYLQVGNASGGEKVRHLFEQAERGQASLLMSVVNMGEVLYILMKFVGEQTAVRHIKTLQHAIAMVQVDTAQGIQAATLKFQYKLGYADSYAAALALQRKATLVSADGSFQKLGKLIRWLKLPPFHGS
jgi:predicted nucleic acid-binding protein